MIWGRGIFNKYKESVLLYQGNAAKQVLFTLNKPYTDFRFLFVYTGIENITFEGFCVVPVLGEANQLMGGKFWSGDGNTQIHVIVLEPLYTTSVKAIENHYITLPSGKSSDLYVKKVYGII